MDKAFVKTVEDRKAYLEDMSVALGFTNNCFSSTKLFRDFQEAYETSKTYVDLATKPDVQVYLWVGSTKYVARIVDCTEVKRGTKTRSLQISVTSREYQFTNEYDITLDLDSNNYIGIDVIIQYVFDCLCNGDEFERPDGTEDL